MPSSMSFASFSYIPLLYRIGSAEAFLKEGTRQDTGQQARARGPQHLRNGHLGSLAGRERQGMMRMVRLLEQHELLRPTIQPIDQHWPL